MKKEFAYIQKGDQFYPIIEVKLKTSLKKLSVRTLVDSGANISIFNEEVAQQLGIDIERGQKIYLGGVGGRIMGYIHKLKTETAGKTFSCRIVFSQEFKVSFNLIGREDFFKKFIITFDEKKKKVILE